MAEVKHWDVADYIAKLVSSAPEELLVTPFESYDSDYDDSPCNNCFNCEYCYEKFKREANNERSPSPSRSPSRSPSPSRSLTSEPSKQQKLNAPVMEKNLPRQRKKYYAEKDEEFEEEIFNSTSQIRKLAREKQRLLCKKLNQLEREKKTNKAVLPSRKTEARRRKKGVNNNKTRYDFTV
jgi:hypothetical protein